MVRLPCKVQDSTGMLPQTEAVLNQVSEAAGQGQVMLVIDDDPSVRDLMVRFMSREGFRVETASSGEEGIEKARVLHPAVITLDVLMPGMDGWSVLSTLKADPDLDEIPVIMLTMIDDKNMGYTLGASDYMIKPIDRGRLATILKKYQCGNPPCPILLVEDDRDTRDMMRRTLEREGWEVTEAENGQAGLTALERSQPELIVLDLLMPGMDGFQFVEAIRRNESWRSIPVVVVTAKDLNEMDLQRLNGYVEGVLQKGEYSREDLLAEVKNWVLTCTSGAK
jgi:CheY-like chemotaxis protein